MQTTERFDEQYFRRFYESKRTRVYGEADIARLASGVLGMVEWFGGEVKSVVDLGAGIGLWRDWFKKNRPKIRYVSTDVSAYACERYGHEQRDITTWRPKETFDLVICQGVLPYLDSPAAERAIDNIASMCRGFAYVEAVTRRDTETVCNMSKTDNGMFFRTGAWYRRRLGRHFRPVGCGIHASLARGLGFYELEAP
jgi:hypothetical protein